MTKATYCGLTSVSETPEPYDPSQKYGPVEHLSYSLDNEEVSFFKDVHTAVNLTTNMHAIEDPSSIFCYFTRLTDTNNNKLTAIRRATYFKGVVKQKLITWMDDNFHLVPDKVFKLDNDFDILIHNGMIMIYHPAGFEFVGALEQSIRESIPINVEAISKALPIVEFDNILRYALEHPRAGKYLASIKTFGEMNNIDREALIAHCNDTLVVIDTSHDKIKVDDKHIMGFLEVLDRRRYCISLVPDSPEKYLAAHRNKL